MGKYLRPFPLLAAVTLVLLASETSAFAQRGYYGPGYRRPGYYTPYYGGQTHDGFYMRLDIGVGYLSASESYGGGTDYYSGAGLTYGAAFGGAIAPNLIIFGELFGTTVLDATYTYRGSSGVGHRRHQTRLRPELHGRQGVVGRPRVGHRIGRPDPCGDDGRLRARLRHPHERHDPVDAVLRHVQLGPDGETQRKLGLPVLSYGFGTLI